MKQAIPVALAAAFSCASSADISYVQRIEVEGAGAMSLFSSTGTVLTQISGDRSRSDSEFEMNSKLTGLLDRSASSIVRLDKGVSWTLDPGSRSYTEQSFAEVRKQLEQLEPGSGGRRGGGNLPVSEENCRWSEPEFDVESDRSREKIAGIRARRHVVRLNQSCSDPESGQTCDMTWILETWLASRIPARKEVEAFQQAYAEALGLDALLQHAQGPGQALLTMFEGNWEEVSEELAELDGYPLKSIMQMGIGGEQCLTASGDPIALDEVWSNAGTAAYNAALNRAGSEAGRAVGESAGRALGDGIGGSIGGAAIGAAAGELVGGFTGMFKKKNKEKEQSAPAAKSAGGQVTAFRIVSEVTEWNESAIAPERFEEPVGWTRK